MNSRGLMGRTAAVSKLHEEVSVVRLATPKIRSLRQLIFSVNCEISQRSF